MTAPFSGTIDFDLSLRAFDERTTRKARMAYAYTPPWPYFHEPSRTERLDEQQLDLGLTLLAIPRTSRSRIGPTCPKEPYWVSVGQLLTVGILRAKVYEQIQARIDAEALEADRRNRIMAGQIVTQSTDFI